ncbi:hypothetical protein BG006_002735, partial [Podila minutissima]
MESFISIRSQQKMDSWTNMKTRHNLQDVQHKWHKALQKRLLTMSQMTSLTVVPVPQTMMATLMRS